jgi:nicotinate dehydrogenase subunit B
MGSRYLFPSRLHASRPHICYAVSLDWASYPILTFPELPEIVIELIDRPTEKPWGAGEPTAAVVPSAISNAIFDATGARIRSVPFKAEKLQPILRSII